MALTQNNICFPVIHQFSINHYQLYPGQTGTGFTYDVKSGVNIIVGVNGLGKTTLLNILMRLVAGIDHIQAMAGLGMGGRETYKVNTRFFSTRVKDAAVSATATATIGFGKRRLTVTRKLSNLELISLTVDGITVDNLLPDALEDRFKRTVLELTGLQQYYDYLLLIQFVFFFLEDRQALIWDEDAQSEILRVLYYDSNQQVAYRTFYNQISQLDSEIRNTQSVLNKHQRKVSAELMKRADVETAREVATLRKTLEELRKGIEQNEEAVESINATRLQYRDQLEHLKVEREEKISRARTANESFLRAHFSDAENEAMYAVASVIADRGCIVCGSKTERAKLVVTNRVHAHHCPLCEADSLEWENASQDQSSTSLIEEALKLESEAQKTADNVTKLEALLLLQLKQYEERMQLLVQQRKQHEEIRLQLQVLERGLPSNNEELQKLQEKLVGVQEIIDHAKEEKANAEEALSAIIETGEAKVAEVADSIVRRFHEYITGFMAETCVLQYDVREKRIGQGPSNYKFRFPGFSVRLTSGVFKDQASNRFTQRDVSESQSEFIDLAFRMSLIAEITKHSPAMLVVETPEASLDSVFVPRAGNMVRQFLHASQTHPNYLIASTNLNREAMIPALFGVIPESEAVQLAQNNKQKDFEKRVTQALPKAERIERMVNLLKIAAENAALSKYGEEYESEFDRAVFPPWENYDAAKDLAQ